MSGDERRLPRPGELICLCPPDSAAEDVGSRGRLAPLVAGSALAVLAQTLATGVLPLAGAAVAPQPAFATLPMAAMLGGAAVATLPASLLLDAFGRRAAFALGSSLGLAGGLALAAAIWQRHFPLMCLAGFWLGMGQGFGLFYRHAAALGTGARDRGLVLAAVLGAGAMAGVAGPELARLAEALIAPYLFAGSAIAAAVAHALGLTVALAGLDDAGTRMPALPLKRRGAVVLPTLGGAAAWFAMAFGMAGAPLALQWCGVGAGTIFGAVAWHVVAMYAAAAGGALLASHFGGALVAAAGLAIAAAAVATLMIGADAGGAEMALIAVGIGWGLAMAAVTLELHREPRPGRWTLAAHDGALAVAAMAGAVAAATRVAAG